MHLYVNLYLGSAETETGQYMRSLYAGKWRETSNTCLNTSFETRS